jgi:hypothetical protein
MGEEGISDPAEGLKTLRGVAVNAVKEVGIDSLIFSSITDFKCVSNRLIADLQTTGKVHGGAQLLFLTNQDNQKKSWVVVPMPNGHRGNQSDIGGDSSPGGAAFEAEWNKEEAAIRAGLGEIASSRVGSNPGGSRMSKFLGKMKFRRRSIDKTAAGTITTQSPSLETPHIDDMDDGDSAGINLTGIRRQSISPPEENKKNSSKSEKATKAFKSIRRKLGSIITTTSTTKGYSRGGFDE